MIMLFKQFKQMKLRIHFILELPVRLNFEPILASREWMFINPSIDSQKRASDNLTMHSDLSIILDMLTLCSMQPRGVSSALRLTTQL